MVVSFIKDDESEIFSITLNKDEIDYLKFIVPRKLVIAPANSELVFVVLLFGLLIWEA